MPNNEPKIIDPLVEYATDVDELTLDPSNARQHSDRNLQAIADSLEAYGQRTPLVVQVKDDDTRVIRKGNGTYRAATEILGWDQIAVVEVVEDDTTATGYAIADNRTGELATWKEDQLAELLNSLDDQTFQATGFTEEELNVLDADWNVDTKDPDDIDDYDEGDDLLTLEVDNIHIDDKREVQQTVNDALDEAGFEEYEAHVY